MKVILSFATTQNGYLNQVDPLDTSKKLPLSISCAETYKMVHVLRSQCDCILVGSNTVLCDNPQLTARIVQSDLDAFLERNQALSLALSISCSRNSDCIIGSPIPVILDSKLGIPLDAKLLKHPHPPIIFASNGVNLQQQIERIRAIRPDVRIETISYDTNGGGLDLKEVCQVLFNKYKMNSLMVEGGLKVLYSFLKSGIVTQVVHTISQSVTSSQGDKFEYDFSQWDCQEFVCSEDIVNVYCPKTQI